MFEIPIALIFLLKISIQNTNNNTIYLIRFVYIMPNCIANNG